MPKLPDELGEDVFQFGSEVPPHVITDASYAFQLSTSQRGKFLLNKIRTLKSSLQWTRVWGDAYHDSGMWRQRLGVHDEEDDLDEAQCCFYYLSGTRWQQQANVVQQLLPGGHLDGIWET